MTACLFSRRSGRRETHGLRVGLRHRGHGQNRGFTLMELLIAVVIFSIVLAAINAVFYGALRLRNKTAATLDAAWPIEHTLTLLQQDLANVVAPGGMLSGQLQTTRTASQTSTTSAPNQALLNQPGQSSPEFHTSTGVLDEFSPWAEVQKVSYYLIAPTNGNGGYGKDLVRAVTRNLLPTVQEQPVLTPVLAGVQSIYFYYFDGTQWQESWDSTTATTAALPKAIKVQITMAPPDRTTPAMSQQPPIELVVPIWVGGVTNATSQTVQTAGGAP